MNERIKELEKKCWDHQTNHLNAEKFAELLIRECVSVELYWLSEHDRIAVAEKIKQHFGVEQ